MSSSVKLTVYKRPQKKQFPLPLPSPQLLQYNSIFGKNKINLTLKSLSTAIGDNDKYFMGEPLYILYTTNKKTINKHNNFKNELTKIHLQKYKSVGFVVIYKDDVIFHMIGGIIFPKTNTIELYDQNGAVCVSHNSFYNKIYNLTYIYINDLLNGAYNRKNIINQKYASTCDINPCGICSLWTLFYIFLRMNNVNNVKIINKIKSISSNPNRQTIMVQFMNLLQIIKNSNNKNKKTYFRGLLKLINPKNI